MSNTLAELQELQELQMRVDACCVDCNKYRALNLQALRDRYGADERLGTVRGRLICATCGRRNQRVILRPPGTY